MCMNGSAYDYMASILARHAQTQINVTRMRESVCHLAVERMPVNTRFGPGLRTGAACGNAGPDDTASSDPRDCTCRDCQLMLTPEAA